MLFASQHSLIIKILKVREKCIAPLAPPIPSPLDLKSILNMELLKQAMRKEQNLRPCLRLEWAACLRLEWAS